MYATRTPTTGTLISPSLLDERIGVAGPHARTREKVLGLRVGGSGREGENVLLRMRVREADAKIRNRLGCRWCVV